MTIPTERLMLIVPHPLVGAWEKEFHRRDTPLNYYQTTVIKHASQSNEGGFLVWHDMGTGKTLTGTNYLTSFIPSEILTKGVELKDVCQIVTYKNLITELLAMRCPPKKDQAVEQAIFDFTDRRIVCDEAHNITTIMCDDRILSDVRAWFYYHIRRSRQVLLMTGTPMYHRAMDIATLINLCTPKQGKDACSTKVPLIPFDDQQFRKEFYKISYWKVGLFGWLVPILNNPLIKYSALILTGMAFTKFVSDLSDVLRTPEAQFTHTGQQYSLYKSTVVSDTLHNTSGGRFLLKMSGMIGMNSTLERGEASGASSVWAFPMGATAAFCSMLAILKKYDLNHLYRLDCKRLGTRIGPFLSFYTYRPMGTLLKTLIKRVKKKRSQKKTVCERPHFKPEHFEVVEVPYNQMQNTLFLDFTIGAVDVDHQKYFKGEVEGVDDYFNIFGLRYERDPFLQFGRVIGSLTLMEQHDSSKNAGGGGAKMLSSFSSIARHWPDLFDEMPSIPSSSPRTRRRGGNVKSLLHRDGVIYPKKFQHVLYHVLNTLNHPKHKTAGSAYHVVFSEFTEHALLQLKRFIEGVPPGTSVPHPTHMAARTVKVPNRPLRVIELPDDGQEPDEYDVLLLHANKTEGINLHYSDNLHILEPLDNPSRLDQLKARTNRYNAKGYSHTQKRMNHVRMYLSTNASFCTNLCRKIQHWKSANNKQGRIFWKRFKKFDQDTTPDRIVYQKMQELRENIKALSKSCSLLAELNHTSLEYDRCRKTTALMPDNTAIANCSICTDHITPSEKAKSEKAKSEKAKSEKAKSEKAKSEKAKSERTQSNENTEQRTRA